QKSCHGHKPRVAPGEKLRKIHGAHGDRGRSPIPQKELHCRGEHQKENYLPKERAHRRHGNTEFFLHVSSSSHSSPTKVSASSRLRPVCRMAKIKRLASSSKSSRRIWAAFFWSKTTRLLAPAWELMSPSSSRIR